jgi:molybdenum cofactor synthesis domain-containing protein
MTLGMTEVYESKFKQQVEAGGFRSLVKHLQDRSDSVQNIDLMTISGFCRNCLAKWLVIEARKLASTVRSVCGELSDEEEKLVKDLDAFGYDEAAEYVYGCTYPEWKNTHQKKATEDQMARYNASSKIHAVHDKRMLETRGEKGPASFEAKDISSTQSPSSNLSADKPTTEASLSTPATNHEKTKGEKSVILSDVCCEDVDVSPNTAPSTLSSNGSASCSTTYRTPPPPSNINLSLRVGILTVSDRAANGEYEHGDLSGPAVEQSLTDNISKANTRRNKTDTGSVNINYIVKAIVPDEIDRIKNQLLQWCGSNGSGSICDVIFTTGGTGFSHRDVTPDATKEILEKDASGLMTFVLAQCAAIQPLAVLSRGIAGIRGRTLIVNIPGNPRAAEQVLGVLFPFILYAVKDLIKE